MSYVDGYIDRKADIIHIVERKDGLRIFKEFPVRFVFYYEDVKGKYKSIYGDPLSRVVCKNTDQFRKELAFHKSKKLFESDFSPIFRCLSENYLNVDSPDLNICFFDIETDFELFKYSRRHEVKIKDRDGNVENINVDKLSKLKSQYKYKVWDTKSKSWVSIASCDYLKPGRGFAPPDDPFMPITAITVHLQWINSLVTVALCPPTLSLEEAKELTKDIENTFIFDDEAEMLNAFLDLIEDADVISGWNSDTYDIPYTVNRVERVLSKDDTRRFCLWNQFPKKKEFEKYGKKTQTYETVGRIHLDSLELYRKYNYEERQSYRLDAIGEIEIGERKTVYEGTLDQLYNNDFKLFIIYNRQDVALLDKLDKKLKFIDLTNELAHANTVLLPTTMGAVAVTEQAIINEAHERGLQVPNRKDHGDDETNAAGAYVAYPKKGLHKWFGSMDLNSLYPSVIRALNMAPETIVGQVRLSYTNEMISNAIILDKKSFAAAWEGHFATLEYEYILEQRRDIDVTIDWENGKSEVMSAAQAYELIFNSNKPWLFSANGTILTNEFEGVIPGLLTRWYNERKELQKKKKEAQQSGTPEEIAYWDKRQLIKKINLNSVYGALLNAGCRFFDKRIGQSTTLTGRRIVRHMSAEINKIITGDYNHTGVSIIYGDSVTGDTLLRLSDGSKIPIEDLYNKISYKIVQDCGKEYAILTPDENTYKVLGYDNIEDNAVWRDISYVMRHETSKKKYRVTSESGKEVIVTEDHSLIVDRDGFTIEVKPNELRDNDLLILVNNSG